MLILTLIDVQYSQKAVFSFEKGLNCPNHPSPGSLHLVTPPPPYWMGNLPPTFHCYLESPAIYLKISVAPFFLGIFC